MRTLTLIAVTLGGLTWFASNAAASDRSVFQLPQHSAAVQADGSTPVQATEVRGGYGWRGYGYYPGWGRPAYGGGYRGNLGYYGGYNRYYGGGYGNYYRPYYNSYRPYYGGGYYYR